MRYSDSVSLSQPASAPRHSAAEGARRQSVSKRARLSAQSPPQSHSQPDLVIQPEAVTQPSAVGVIAQLDRLAIDDSEELSTDSSQRLHVRGVIQGEAHLRVSRMEDEADKEMDELRQCGLLC